MRVLSLAALVDVFKSSHGYIRVYRIDIVGIACHRAAMSQDSRQ